MAEYKRNYKPINKNNDKNNKKYTIKTIDGLIAVFIVSILVLAAFINLVHRPKAMSEKENRELASFPKLSISTILNGSFMSEFETFASDQFTWRNSSVTNKANIEHFLKKKENNGVNFAKNHYLITRPSKFDKNNVDKNINALKTLQEKGGYNMTVAVVPTAYEILKEKLPKHAYDNRMSQVINEVNSQFKDTDIKVCDTTSILNEHNKEDIYYKTDHHQTALGSYYTYTELAGYLDIPAYTLDSYNREKLTDDFYGTSWSSASISSAKPDSIEKFMLKGYDANTKVDFPLENNTMNGLYNTDNLAKKDKYTVYLDGNHGLTVINSDNNTGKSLAVLKDSYAHSIAPFLATEYEHIYLIDMRYYNEDLLMYLGENKVKDMLVLYDADTFNTDTSLAGVGDIALTTSYHALPPFGLIEEQDEQVEDNYFADAVFFGDSITVGHSMYSSLPAKFICQTSINTSTMNTNTSSGETLIQQLLDDNDAKKYYLMMGINEVNYTPVDSFIKRYGNMIDKIKNENPDALIYIESLMPIEKRVEGNPIKKSSIESYNSALEKLAEEKECFYLDINSYIAGTDGYLPSGSASDGIHFSKSIHDKWDDYLKSHAVQTGLNAETQVFNLYSGGGSVDVQGFADEVLSSIDFKDTMNSVQDNVAARMFNLEENFVKQGIVYTGGGSTAEEFAIFETDSNEKAKEVAEKMKKRVEDRKPSFKSYKPAEMPKLNDPVIIVNGNVAMMIVSDDNSTATKICKKY